MIKPNKILNSLFISLTLFCLQILGFNLKAEKNDDSKTKPNFLVIVVDDLGFMDIGANNENCFYETPNIDNFSKSGMRFTNGYAVSPV